MMAARPAKNAHAKNKGLFAHIKKVSAAHKKKMAKRASAKKSKKARKVAATVRKIKAALTKKKTPSSLRAALTKKPSSKKTIAKKGKVSFIVRKEDEII